MSYFVDSGLTEAKDTSLTLDYFQEHRLALFQHFNYLSYWNYLSSDPYLRLLALMQLELDRILFEKLTNIVGFCISRVLVVAFDLNFTFVFSLLLYHKPEYWDSVVNSKSALVH